MLLAKQHARRNLASFALGLERLSDDWHEQHRLLLAETFTSRFEGTV